MTLQSLHITDVTQTEQSKVATWQMLGLDWRPSDKSTNLLP